MIPATIASHKGRNYRTWYFYSFLLLIVAFVHSLLIRPTEGARRQDLAVEGYKACQFCDEMIRPNAVVCRYCGRELDDDDDDDDDGPLAGWYPNPDGGPNLRWWDGEDWTEQVRLPDAPKHARSDSD